MTRSYRDRKHFVNEEVDLVELYRRIGKLEGYQFEGCTLRGPAVVFLENTYLTNNELHGGPAEGTYWPIDDDRTSLVGAILIASSSINNCVLIDIGVVVSRTDYPRFVANSQVGVESEGDWPQERRWSE